WCALVVVYHPSKEQILTGVAYGALYALIAIGLILIYRTNRVINFAVAAIGAVPATLAALLVSVRHWSYWVAFPLVMIGGPLVGGIVEVTIIRRFGRAPRLILTVATLGIAQVLAF